MVGGSVRYKNVPDLYFPKYVVVVPLLGRNKTKHYFQVQLFLLTPEVTWIVIVVYCSTYSRYIVFVVLVVVSLLPEKNQAQYIQPLRNSGFRQLKIQNQ